MRFAHASHPGRHVRLTYCLNVHPARSLAEFYTGLENVTLPLRERVAPGLEFGVGLYLPATVARELREDSAALARLTARFHSAGLDPFTANAFPYGGFGAGGLKQRVFEPTWWAPGRMQYTLDVAHIAHRLRTQRGPLSISTHTGAHSTGLRGRPQGERVAQCARAWSEFGAELERAELADVWLALEPEPDALLGSLSALELAWSQLPSRPAGVGVCFDACHAAVMFEDPAQSVERAFGLGSGLAKLQFTSALALRDPGRAHLARQALFDLDEPRYLHQLAARAADGSVVVAPDLGPARDAYERGESTLRDAQEWRCHFHVPTDLAELDVLGLEVTSAYAADVLRRVLEQPARWPRDELHVEIETYTWSILPAAARRAEELVDALEREYRHVIALLERAHWRID